MISFKKDARGTIISNAWEGQCREPEEPCPTRCQFGQGGTSTCYTCTMPATCKGSLVHTGFQLIRRRCHETETFSPSLSLERETVTWQ